MELNCLVYPQPKCLRIPDEFQNNVIWIPIYANPHMITDTINGDKVKSFQNDFSNLNSSMKVIIKTEHVEAKIAKRRFASSSFHTVGSKPKYSCNFDESNVIDDEDDNNDTTSQFRKGQQFNTIALSDKMKQINSVTVDLKKQLIFDKNSEIQKKMTINKLNLSVGPQKKTRDVSVYSSKLVASNKRRASVMQIVVNHHVPCVLLTPTRPCDKILIYFHGNAEDIFLSVPFCQAILTFLNIYILIPEYPGYGIYKNKKPNENSISSDAQGVFEFVNTNLGFKSENILVIGRSLGSGPAIHVGSFLLPGALALISPFSSIQAVAVSLVGKIGKILKDQFNNLEKIKKIKCPVFILHGRQDRLVPFTQAKELYDECQSYAEIKIPTMMTHSTFSFLEDFLYPFKNFLYEINLFEDCMQMKNIEIPRTLYRIPRYYEEQVRKKKLEQQL